MPEEDPPIRLLLIEDDEADLRLLEETLKEIPANFRLEYASTGAEALRRLDISGPSEQLPEVVLLDLNLPGLDGRKVLAHLREVPQLAALPVVVITASPADVDVLTAFDLRAQGYLRKPVEAPSLHSVLSRVSSRVPPPPGEPPRSPPPKSRAVS
ncbi:MAG TPA: response regulator [Thermoplasmata archaeon]|nr:response regulator [Thermoplasmata archaeon]